MEEEKQLKRVLVTGSAGRLGRSVIGELDRRGLPVRGCDLTTTGAIADEIVGDLNEVEIRKRALDRIGTLIHLGATPDDADFERELLPNNLTAVYRLFEAAREAGVHRLILASSGQVNWLQQQEGPWPVRTTDPISPRYWYAATKAFLEAAGRAFAHRYAMEVLAVRIGWCPRTTQHASEIDASEVFQDVYLSQYDAARFFALAAEAGQAEKFQLIFATSRPRHQMRLDLEPARELIGYEPVHQWPEGLDSDWVLPTKDTK